MDAERTDPAIDAGPTILYAVQTVEEAIPVGVTTVSRNLGDCPNCGGTGRVHSLDDEECERCHGDGFVDEDYSDFDDGGWTLDDLGMDPDDGPEIDPAEYRSWHRFCVGEQKRGVNRQRTTKGHERRALRWMSRRDKRLSAMRRQGKGGGR